MRPVLLSVFGFDVQTYGVSKVLAAWVAALLLGRAFERRRVGSRQQAYSLVMWSTVWGFVGAKVYYLLEQVPTLTMHDFGGMGFTWYGGLLGGAAAALIMLRRWRLPLGVVAGAVAAPLSVGYAIGRLGCLLSGDGTYGRPTTLPWGMTFPNGVVATDVAVHPTPLYEAIGALVIAAVLWRLGRVTSGPTVFAWYLILSGVARFVVEFLRTNEPVLLGLTQPQLWALTSVLGGMGMLVWSIRRDRRPSHATAAADAPQAPQRAALSVGDGRPRTRTAEEPHIALGAYVLGSLSAEDHRGFTIHLRSCRVCRTEFDGLAGLPRLLDLLDQAAVEKLAGSLLSGRASPARARPNS